MVTVFTSLEIEPSASQQLLQWWENEGTHEHTVNTLFAQSCNEL